MEDAVHLRLHVRTGLICQGRWNSGKAAVAALADLFSPVTPPQITQPALCPVVHTAAFQALQSLRSLQIFFFIITDKIGTKTILNLVQKKAPTLPSSKV